MGESWHNNHNAFPTSAAHGLRASHSLRAWEVDLSGLAIQASEFGGLEWDVRRVTGNARAAAIAPPTR